MLIFWYNEIKEYMPEGQETKTQKETVEQPVEKAKKTLEVSHEEAGRALISGGMRGLEKVEAAADAVGLEGQETGQEKQKKQEKQEEAEKPGEAPSLRAQLDFVLTLKDVYDNAPDEKKPELWKQYLSMIDSFRKDFGGLPPLKDA